MITSFSTVLTQLFTSLWWLSWQAGLLTAMVVLSQLLFRKWLAAQWRYGLWLLVVARLLLPFSLASSLSVFNVVRREPPPTAVPTISHVVTAASTAASVLRPVTPLASPVAVVPAKRSVLREPVLPAQSTVAQAPPTTPPAPVLTGARTLPRRVLSGWTIAAWTWLVGAVVFAAYAGWGTWRFLRGIRFARVIDDPSVVTLLENCRRQMQVRVTVGLRETALVKSPALCGIFRPRLLLPPDLIRRFSPEELRYVFLHELAHVKHRDVAMNWLITLLQALHWFNPLLWFGFARMRADREAACDALAMSCSSEQEAKTYGLTIIKLLENFARSTPSPGLVGVVENPRQMKRRIQLIATFRKNRRWSWVAAALMVILATTGLTDAVRSSRAQEATPGKPTDPDKEGVLLRLTVLDAQTSRPIPKAMVVPGFASEVTFAEKPPMLYTDANGVAVIKGKGAFEKGACCGVFSDDYASRLLTTFWSSEQLKKDPPREYIVRLERGRPIGGTLRDETGLPLAGVRVTVRGFLPRGPHLGVLPPIQEQPCYDPMFAPGVVTDQDGHWTCEHFAAGQGAQIDFERVDGAFARFHSPRDKWDTGLGGETISLESAWQGALVCVFRRGIDVRGQVVDTTGQPLAGIKVVETDGRHHGKPVSTSETGADGRLLWRGRDPHQVLLTLTGAGLAPRVETVSIGPDMPELSLTMHPSTPLRLQVLDTDGKPVAGTEIKSSVQTLPWTGTTDAAGRVGCERAPVEPTAYDVAAAGYGPRHLQFAATGEEQTIVLRRGDPPGVLVTIKGLDAARHPLKTFTITAAYQTNGGIANEYNLLEPLGQGKDGSVTVIVPTQNSQRSDFRVRIESPGQQPFTSEPLEATPRDVDLTAVLSAVTAETSALPPDGGDHAQITLRLPGGKPAAGASVVVNDSAIGHESYLSLYFFGNRRPQVEGDHKKTVVANASGGVELPTGAADAPAIVLHENAYLFTTLGKLRRQPETTLDAWGRIEGTFTINGRPTADQRLHLQPHYGNAVVRLSYQISTNTDREGHFVFDRVPADQHTLSCTQVSEGTWSASHAIDVPVTAGQTTPLAYAVVGRTVDGKFRPDPADAEIDWKKDVGECLLTAQRTNEAAPLPNRPAYEDFVQYEDFKRADEDFLKTHRFQDAAERQDTYAAVFDANGGFHFEGIPPGTYEFHLELSKSSVVEHQRQQQPFGSFKQTVFVPQAPPEHGNLAVDLGTLAVAVDAATVPRRPLVTLTARTLDGESVQLANYRGKPVLLTFWASWAPPTPQEIDDLKSILRTSDQRLTMLALSLDDDPAAARQFAQSHQLPGTQARLEGQVKSDVTEALGIDELPAMFLVGPDSRVAARNLSGPQLRAAVDSVLTAAP